MGQSARDLAALRSEGGFQVCGLGKKLNIGQCGVGWTIFRSTKFLNGIVPNNAKADVPNYLTKTDLQNTKLESRGCGTR